MWRNNWILTVAVCVIALLSVSCGGGANDNPPSSTVFITLDVDSNDGSLGRDHVAADMVSLQNTFATATIAGATSSSEPVDPTVGVITLRRYRITFERIDGGSPNLPSVEGAINETIEVSNITTSQGLASEAIEDIVVVPISTKLYSDFALAFQQNPNPVEFNAVATVWGDNRAGQSLSRDFGFRVTVGVFTGTDTLIPEVDTVNESKNVTLGNPYRMFWSFKPKPFPVSSASLILPWGVELNVPSNQFPFGGVEVDTNPLSDRIRPGASETFPNGQLFVFNAFGSSVAEQSGDVTITAPAAGGNSVSIDQFFPDRDAINLGESVSLNWSITGSPDRLTMLPSVIGGETVSFEGKNLSFDSIEVRPDRSFRPLLRAEKNDGSFAEAFTDATITVTSPAGAEPEIILFSASRSPVPVGSQIVLFWNVQGPVDKVELFPINGNRVDVTTRTSFLAPPVNLEGTQVYTLVVTGTDGLIKAQTVSVAYTLNDNRPISITSVDQQPSEDIPNGGTASFDFRVDDPDRSDSSWRVRRIAGDRASHFPTEGKIDEGLGEASVAIRDGVDNNLGYIVFEISAWDDDLFGLTPDATRYVELVTFTTGAADANATNEVPRFTADPAFITAGDEPEDTIPGVNGVITFAFADPDTEALEWSIRIIGGDYGGDLTPNFGLINTGEGSISVQYRDDPDTPDDPVIFEVRIAERGVEFPQFDIAVLRVDKGVTPDGGNGGGNTLPITLGFDGLYNNLFGGVQPTQVIADYILFFPGSGSGNINFFRNSDLTEPVADASAVFDLAHSSGNPGDVSAAQYSRNFQSPGGSGNAGNLSFAGYFANAGATTAASGTPIADGVSRWFMAFNTSDFENTGGGFNLPASGNQVYQITVTASDADSSSATFNRVLTVTVP